MVDVIPAIADRRARRAFDSRQVPAEVAESLWQAFSLAPSHGNSQPWRLLVASEPAVRGRLFEALSEGNRQWAGTAPLLVAVGALPGHDPTPSGGGGRPRELWPFHAGIAAGNLLAQATALGLTAHPMAGFDETLVRAAFGAPEELRILAVIAIGYPGDPASLPPDLREREERPRRRLPLEVVVATSQWSSANGDSARQPGGRAGRG